MYIFTRENLIAKRHRISDKPLMFEIPRLEAVDIDEESDFQIADILMKMRMENQ
jgi:CMP-N-acetylneuraminic acid synthetase